MAITPSYNMILYSLTLAAIERFINQFLSNDNDLNCILLPDTSVSDLHLMFKFARVQENGNLCNNFLIKFSVKLTKTCLLLQHECLINLRPVLFYLSSIQGNYLKW